MECIQYKKGYKYQLVEQYIVNINIASEQAINTDYIALNPDGELIIRKGYAWDGPSGPTIDTLNFMRGSLVHDALYQLMRGNYLSKDEHREAADRLLQKMCREDGMMAVRAWWVYMGVRFGGDDSAGPANKKPVVSAPKGC